MKEALQQIEAENQETENEPKPEPPMSTKIFLNISDTIQSMFFKAAISGSLVVSQAVYRAAKRTIEQRSARSEQVLPASSNPLG